MAVLIDGELVLYGFVGDDWWGEGFTAIQVIEALAEVGRDTDVTVRINSGGGYVDDGISIYNALIAHRGAVNVVVDGVAMSSASLIAMAGDTRVMRRGTIMMIHDPGMITFGNADDHRKSVDQLDMLGDLMAGIYADVIDGDAADVRAEMKEELFLSPDQALERGFATEVADDKSREVAAFDYRVYAGAPKRLKKAAANNDWSIKPKTRAAAVASPPTPKKERAKMAKEPKTAGGVTGDAADIAATAATEARDRIKAIMQSDIAAGQTGLAEHFAYNTDLPAEDAIAAMTAAAGDVSAAPSGEGDPAPQPAPTGKTAYQERRSAAAAVSAGADGDGKPKASKTPAIDRKGIFANFNGKAA